MEDTLSVSVCAGNNRRMDVDDSLQMCTDRTGHKNTWRNFPGGWIGELATGNSVYCSVDREHFYSPAFILIKYSVQWIRRRANDNKWAIFVQLCQIGAVLTGSLKLLSVDYNRYKPSFYLACLALGVKKKKENASRKFDSPRPTRNGCAKIEVVWPYDSSPTRPPMWVDFVVGSCFAVMDFSSVRNFWVDGLLSGGHIIGEVREDNGKDVKKLCVSKMLWFSLKTEESVGLKKFSYVQEYRKVKSSKHQDRKQSSLNEHHESMHTVTTFKNYRTRSLTAP